METDRDVVHRPAADGRLFHLARPFHFEPDEEKDVEGHVNQGLLLWVITWIGSAAGPQVEKVTQYLSIVDHFEDFGKGVLDTTHFIYYLSFITFGLFLTAKSVDSERWRG